MQFTRLFPDPLLLSFSQFIYFGGFPSPIFLSAPHPASLRTLPAFHLPARPAPPFFHFLRTVQLSQIFQSVRIPGLSISPALPAYDSTTLAVISRKFCSIYVPLLQTIGIPLFVEICIFSSY